jgi:hypothetical protein
MGTEWMLAIPEEYAAYRSAYLSGGYHEDTASLDEVQITRSAVRGSFSMTSRFEGTGRSFELSTPTLVVWTLQLCVIYGCRQHGCATAREISLREISLKRLRPVTDPTPISVRLRLRFRRPVPDGMHYVGDIDVDHGAFIGRIGFTFPTD